MNWRDDRLHLQLEWALSRVSLYAGSDVIALVHHGDVEVTGRLTRWAELAAILSACEEVPGLGEITFRVSIAESGSLPEDWPDN
jgi:hypothetical protein